MCDRCKSLKKATPDAEVDDGQTHFRVNRPKLWELELDIHCSIIGTCVPISELRKIYKRVNKVSSKRFDDYQIHNLFVSSADKPLVGIRMLQKYLERTHARVISCSRDIQTEVGLRKFWRKCVSEGNIAGGYWAVMTHPSITQGLYTVVFGQVHMMSHIAGRLWEADSVKCKQLEARLEELKKKYHRQQPEIMDLQKRLVAERQEQDALKARVFSQARDIDDLRCQVRKLENAEARGEQLDRVAELEQQLRQQQQSAATAAEKASVSIRRKLDAANRKVQSGQAERTRLEHRIELLLAQAAGQAAENSASEQICGRCVLYVGGQSGAQASFRQLVEQMGGKFLYHDGGREDSRQRLDGLICQADAVVCPASCVSHSAMHKIKQVCSRQSKPTIWLRSSSLSAFNNALSEVADDAA